jgi:hypothetical protein
MKKAIQKKMGLGGKRPGAGRPATGNDPVRTFRMSDEFVAKLDAWAAAQEDKPARAEAIRRLVERGLTVKTKGHQSKEGQKKRAREMAGTAIDDMTDTAASPDDQVSRKRRLLKGPKEFRDVRVDRPNRKA